MSLSKSYLDIEGMRFSHVIAISKIDECKAKRWKCLCDCGKYTIKYSYALRKKPFHSCGCIKPVDEKLIGTTVGDWLIIGKSSKKTKSYNSYYICQNKKCGCKIQCQYRFIKKNKHSFCPVIYSSFKKLSHLHYSMIEAGAKIRGLEFNITKEYLYELFESQKERCALTNLPITLIPDNKKKTLETASLDRIDSDKGYIRGNVHWVHKTINLIKWSLSVDELIYICSLITSFNKERLQNILSIKSGDDLIKESMQRITTNNRKKRVNISSKSNSIPNGKCEEA